MQAGQIVGANHIHELFMRGKVLDHLIVVEVERGICRIIIGKAH